MSLYLFLRHQTEISWRATLRSTFYGRPHSFEFVDKRDAFKTSLDSLLNLLLKCVSKITKKSYAKSSAGQNKKKLSGVIFETIR